MEFDATPRTSSAGHERTTATVRFGVPPAIAVELRRSSIGEAPKVRGTLRALGLRRRGSIRVHQTSPEILGMVGRVRHLVAVTPMGQLEVNDWARTHRVPPRLAASVQRFADLDLPQDPNIEVSPVGRHDRSIVSTQSSDAFSSVTFRAGVTAAEAVARIPKALTQFIGARSVDSITTRAVVWDPRDGQIREFRGQGEARPWAGFNAVFALFSASAKDIEVGFETPLSRPASNVEIVVRMERGTLELIESLVVGLGGPRLREVEAGDAVALPVPDPAGRRS